MLRVRLKSLCEWKNALNSYASEFICRSREINKHRSIIFSPFVVVNLCVLFLFRTVSWLRKISITQLATNELIDQSNNQSVDCSKLCKIWHSNIYTLPLEIDSNYDTPVKNLTDIQKLARHGKIKHLRLLP